MARQMDDENLRPRPTCVRCQLRKAAWVVTVGGDHSARLKVCTVCAKSKELKNGRRRAMHAQDY